ncbi:MAG: CoA transferase, partial [Chloroflexi bacterium]|nr:CoA transferase [Chloroflexota bacterium]
MAVGLLPGVRVLDIGQGISAPYCTKILAHMGAEVIKVEPPEGDVARGMGPFPGDSPHPEKSGLFLALNTNKYGITLDLTSPDGAETLRELVTSADIVVENPPPDSLEANGLGYETLRGINPGLIFTSVTPFGNRGPYADFKATDLVLYHMSGHAHGLLGAVENPDSDPPIRAGGHQAEFVG